MREPSVLLIVCLLSGHVLGCEAMLRNIDRNSQRESAQKGKVGQRMAEQDGYDAIRPDDLGPALAGRRSKFCTDRQDLKMRAERMPGPDDKERQAAVDGWVAGQQAPSGRLFIVLQYTMQGGGGGQEVWISVPASDTNAFRQATNAGQTYCVWLDGTMDQLPEFKTRKVYHFPAARWEDSNWLDAAPAVSEPVVPGSQPAEPAPPAVP